MCVCVYLCHGSPHSPLPSGRTPGTAVCRGARQPALSAQTPLPRAFGRRQCLELRPELGQVLSVTVPLDSASLCVQVLEAGSGVACCLNRVRRLFLGFPVRQLRRSSWTAGLDLASIHDVSDQISSWTARRVGRWGVWRWKEEPRVLRSSSGAEPFLRGRGATSLQNLAVLSSFGCAIYLQLCGVCHLSGVAFRLLLASTDSPSGAV